MEWIELVNSSDDKVMINMDAVAELLADSFKTGESYRAVVNGIIAKMPLFVLEE